CSSCRHGPRCCLAGAYYRVGPPCGRRRQCPPVITHNQEYLFIYHWFPLLRPRRPPWFEWSHRRPLQRERCSAFRHALRWCGPPASPFCSYDCSRRTICCGGREADAPWWLEEGSGKCRNRWGGNLESADQSACSSTRG